MKTYLSLIGFILFLIGTLSVILALVGLNLSFLSFLDQFGAGFAFTVKLIMIFGGMILFYVARTAESPEE